MLATLSEHELSSEKTTTTNKCFTIKIWMFCSISFSCFVLQSENFAEENELAMDAEPCYGRPCTANEHCCPGSVCVDVDGGKFFIAIFFFSPLIISFFCSC